MLLLSICNVETGLKNINHYQDHNGGSYGVAQVQLRTARGIDKHVDLLALQSPEVNITIAAKYLKQLSKRYKTDREIIAAYNAGGVYYKNNELINKKYVDSVIDSSYCFSDKLCFYNRKGNLIQ
jgi:hypothetical protein